MDLLGHYDKVRVRRWRFRTAHDAQDLELSLGYLPDGSWWVDDTRERFRGWVYTGPPEEARTAAEARVQTQMGAPYPYAGVWEPMVATYRPGTHLPADVPEWPPGHVPD